MTDKKPELTSDQIIRLVIANGRLADASTDEEPLEVIRKIVHGEISSAEFDEYENRKTHEIRKNEAKDRLKIKYLPIDFDFNLIDKYEHYLSMSGDDQNAFVAGMSIDEYEFWNDLDTARALYIDPLDRADGSITEAKLERHKERYGWKT